MLCIHTHCSLGLLCCQEAFSVSLLPDCFSTDVFQRFWYESLLLHTFSLQSARAVNGNDDITDVSITVQNRHLWSSWLCFP